MNLTLVRKEHILDGILGELVDERYAHVAITLERSYEHEPKLPHGVYTCKRGEHRLEGHEKSFETFEVMNVPHHSGILVHQGNYPHDSSGCILVGYGMGTASYGGKMITDSKRAFATFMELQKETDEFTLTVEGL